MKQLSTRSPLLTFTHSQWRFDLSSRALAQSWPMTAPAIREIAKMEMLDRLTAQKF